MSTHSQTPSIQHATTYQEIMHCFLVMHELRPHLQALTFVEAVNTMQNQGYRLAYLNDTESDHAVAVAGYRIANNLFMGKHCYIDDLVTADSHRSKGYGKHLLSWIREKAIDEDCQVLHLDSGVHRGDAHRFYFNNNMTIASYHFSESLV